MISMLIHVQVKPEFINHFIEATRENHENSIKEDGIFSFDVAQDAKDPGKFILYEVYASEASIAAHKETGHYIKWRDKVELWMAEPRQGIKHQLLFPKVIKK